MDIKIIIGKARTTFNMMSDIWKANNTMQKSKITPILLYELFIALRIRNLENTNGLIRKSKSSSTDVWGRILTSNVKIQSEGLW